MSTCKDCLHYEVCYILVVCNDIEQHIKEVGCDYFKPKADYIEVVRCKDCVHATELNEYEKRCYIEGCVACRQIHQNSERTIMLPTDFCNYGERKEIEVQGE